MPRKQVRFANNTESFSYEAAPTATPSPTYSNSTLSTLGPLTPPLARPQSLHPVYSPSAGQSYNVHAYLEPSTPSLFFFDLSCDPSTTISSAVLPPSILGEAATTPSLPSIFIKCELLPWTISILPSSQTFVTVADVLGGLYRALRTPVLPAEFKRATPLDQTRITDAFYLRFEKLSGPQRDLEYQKGAKRIDFLMERRRFVGLSPLKDGPHVWRLDVAV